MPRGTNGLHGNGGCLRWPRMKRIDSLGIIAGNRSLPLLLARQARSVGVGRLVAVGFEGETDEGLEKLVDRMHWLRVGQLGKMIAAFKRDGITQCVMAGQIAPKNLFDLRPDIRAMMLLVKLKERNAHSIFGAIADELKREGIELIDALPWLEPLMAAKGFSLGPKFSEEQQSDVEFGLRIAKEISRLEIGQLVVVKEGTVLAVEGFEGTDECLRRGGQLAGKSGGAVAVKVAKENHDMRFDIPCVGSKTVQTCAESGVAVLALEAGKTLVLEEEEVAEVARRQKVSVVVVG
jgi:UDP-2,3-diacylglucosamine hydrolase